MQITASACINDAEDGLRHDYDFRLEQFFGKIKAQHSFRFSSAIKEA